MLRRRKDGIRGVDTSRACRSGSLHTSVRWVTCRKGLDQEM
jgi:hypothetical protein